MLMEFKICVGILLALEFVAGVSCNIAVLILPPPKWAKYMKTGNKLIKNLHFIDLAISLFLIPTTFAVLMNAPHINETLCFFHESLISFATCGGCVNILFISLERYGTVSSLNVKSPRTSQIFIVIIWSLSAIGFTLPWINMAYRGNNTQAIIAFEENQTIVDCEHLLGSYNKYNVYEIFGIGIFLLSIVGIVFCYVGIYRIAKNRLVTVPSSKQKQDKRAFKVTVSIVSCFLFCWTMFISVSFVEMVAHPSTAVNAVHLISLSFVFLSTTVHPVLYRFIHGDLRRRFLKRGKTDPSDNSATQTNISATHTNVSPNSTRQIAFVQSVESSTPPAVSKNTTLTVNFTIPSSSNI